MKAVVSIILLLLGAVILVGPPLAVGGFIVWGRRLRKADAPKLAIRASYALAGVVGLLMLWSYIDSMLIGHHANAAVPGASEKARELAQTISQLMNDGALALFIAIVGFVALRLWLRRRAASPS